MLTPIPEILEELRQGRMVILVDDEDRENEGDLPVFMTGQREIGNVEAIGYDLCDSLDWPVLTQLCSVAARRQVAKRDEPGVFICVVQ